MGRRRLTVRMVEQATYTGSGNARCVLWDGEVPGFGLRVYPSGRKSFVLKYGASGRARLMVLGDFPSLDLSEARKRAGKLRSEARDGADPLEERNRVAQGETVSELVDVFLAQHADAKLRPVTASEYRRQLETHVKPRWGSRLAKTIRRSDVAALHTEIGERAPTQANRTLAAVSKMFTFARVKGFIPDDAPNPAQGVERFQESKRDRWVRPGELPRLVAAVNAEPNVYVRAAVWLYLLTGLRRTELLRARWDWVDLERRELRLPTTKAGRTHYVPLSNAALAVLESIPRQDGNPFILCGAGEGGRLGDINHPWQKIRETAGIPDVRLHDLRRTVGSWLATAGESLPLIGKALNHSTPATTQIYARLAEDPVRRALEEHGKRILEAAEGLRVVK